MRLLVAVGLLCVAAVWALLHKKRATRWALPALRYAASNFFVGRPAPVHVLFALVDHWEPGRGEANEELAAQRVSRWIDDWPALAAAHRDADGLPPKHTWCYPWDEWRDGEVAALSRLAYDGLGEVELHLHHKDDTSDSLRAKLLAAREAFARHGALLLCGEPVVPAYGFVHGNWTLDNSHPEGLYCGVNDELTVLAETGCYADFTLPTPDWTQPRRVNRIYRATDDPHRPRSHEWGRPLTVGARAPGDLLLIPGPLGFNLRDWRHRFYPSLEQGEITLPFAVNRARVDFWVRTGVGVRGRPDWVFVKVHTHGCRERDQEAVLGQLRHRLHALLEQHYNDGGRHVLHYCSARELANLALAAEDGHGGDPHAWRDYRLAPPVNTALRSDGPVRVDQLTAGRGDVVALTPTVDWELRLGPVARLRGPVKRLRWQGAELHVDADGDYELLRR